MLTLRQPEPFDGLSFSLDLFRDLGYVEGPESKGWRTLAFSRPDPPVAAFRDSRILVDRSQAWQGFVGHYAVNSAIRLQPDVLFFHAASMAVGSGGVLLTGAKGSGKTTLSLALAARGHGFLGDEYAAVTAVSRTLLPLRRAASVRLGPQADSVRRYLDGHRCETEEEPGGGLRWRAPVGEVFPSAGARPVRLTHAFFLQGCADKPRVQRFTPRPSDLSRMAPLPSTMWNVSPGRRTIQFLNLLAGAYCFSLEAGGTPDETAEIIENTVEATWDSQYGKRLSMSVPTAGWKFS